MLALGVSCRGGDVAEGAVVEAADGVVRMWCEGAVVEVADNAGWGYGECRLGEVGNAQTFEFGRLKGG